MRNIVLASAAAFLLAAPSPATADEPEHEASAEAYETNLPGSQEADFTAQEPDRSAKSPVSPPKVAELRQLAIDQFGQTSSKSAEEEDRVPPPGTVQHANAFFARVENRGVNVPDGN